MVSNLVILSTLHRRCNYMQHGNHRVAKSISRFDGPFCVTQAWPEMSVYTLDLFNHLHIFSTFYAPFLRLYLANNN